MREQHEDRTDFANQTSATWQVLHAALDFTLLELIRAHGGDRAAMDIYRTVLTHQLKGIDPTVSPLHVEEKGQLIGRAIGVVNRKIDRAIKLFESERNP